MEKLLIIVPAYNEEENILKVYKEIKKIKLDNFMIDYVIINDGSTDNTLNILKKNNLSYINLINNLGIGGAMQTGYKFAYYNNYDFAIQFDGDGQHDANYIEKMLENIKSTNSDLSIGSRFIEDLSDFKSTKLRQTGIKLLSFLIYILAKKRIKDVTSGFRLANKKVIAEFAQKYPDDYPEPESIVLLLKKGYQISELPVEMNEREFGESSINSFKSIYYMIKVSLAIIIASFSVSTKLNHLKNIRREGE